MGKLIVIEGSCDGVGKSTQYKLLIDRLINEKEYDITSHHFPSYGTYQGRPVEEYLKGNFGNHSELSPYFVNSLYAQDRAITWVTGLKSEYDKGKLIVLDRYTTSSLIYQSSVINDVKEREAFIDYVYDYEYHKLGIPEPDLVIFLHAPFEITRNLKDKRKAPIFYTYIQELMERCDYLVNELGYNNPEYMATLPDLEMLEQMYEKHEKEREIYLKEHPIVKQKMDVEYEEIEEDLDEMDMEI